MPPNGMLQCMQDTLVLLMWWAHIYSIVSLNMNMGFWGKRGELRERFSENVLFFCFYITLLYDFIVRIPTFE